MLGVLSLDKKSFQQFKLYCNPESSCTFSQKSFSFWTMMLKVPLICLMCFVLCTKSVWLFLLWSYYNILNACWFFFKRGTFLRFETNAGHFAGHNLTRDIWSKCGTVPRNAGRLVTLRYTVLVVWQQTIDKAFRFSGLYSWKCLETSIIFENYFSAELCSLDRPILY